MIIKSKLKKHLESSTLAPSLVDERLTEPPNQHPANKARFASDRYEHVKRLILKTGKIFNCDIYDFIERDAFGKKYYQPLKKFLAENKLGQLDSAGCILNAKKPETDYIGGWSIEIYMENPTKSLPIIEKKIHELKNDAKIKVKSSVYDYDPSSVRICYEEVKTKKEEKQP